MPSPNINTSLGGVYAVGGYISFSPKSSVVFSGNSAKFGKNIATLPSTITPVDPDG